MEIVCIICGCIFGVAWFAFIKPKMKDEDDE